MNPITIAYISHCAEFSRQVLDVADFEARLKNFGVTHKFIEEHNASGANWVAGHNQFSDYHSKEYKAMLGFVR